MEQFSVSISISKTFHLRFLLSIFLLNVQISFQVSFYFVELTLILPVCAISTAVS